MKKLLFLMLVFFQLVNSYSTSLSPVNIYSIRIIEGFGPVVCDFGEVILIPSRRLENRTIMNFDIRKIPMVISNSNLSKAVLIFPIQNQENGLFSSVIDVRVFYNSSMEITTNYWDIGENYSCLSDDSSIQSLDITPLIKNAIQCQKTNINFHLSTIVSNSHCIIVSPPWRPPKTSIEFTYSTNKIASLKNLRVYSSD